MNPIHAHLMLNHAPLFGSAAACALLAYALMRDHDAYKRLAYLIMVLAGLTGPIVAFSGDEAAERIESLSVYPDKVIHAHEEAGEAAAVALGLMGVLAFLQSATYMFPNLARLRNRTALLLLLVGAAVFAWTAYTANLGGKIRHGEELGAGNAAGAAPAGTAGESAGE